jgi:hypothetical protein
MIDCPNGDVRDLLPDYLHERLEPSRRRMVDQHLAECAACRDELALLRDLRGAMRRAPKVDVAAIAAAIPPYRAPVRHRWAGSGRAAAAIAAIAVGGTVIAVLGRTSRSSSVPVSPIAVAPTIQPPVTGPQGPKGSQTAERAAPPARPPALARVAPAPARMRTPQGQELAMAGGAITDLSDGELAALLDDIETLDALPSTEVEGTEPLTPSVGGERR